jgi:imidazolonepropionase-like amidohydrolase
MPGLIDAHVHMCLDPRIGSPASQIAAPRAERLQQALSRAQKMLRAGITTARDLGGGEWLEIEVRDRIERGHAPGPRLLCAGQPVTSPGGHCHFWGGEAEDLPAARVVIERQAQHAVDWIKVMATGGVMTPGSRSASVQFAPRLLAEIVDAAREHGRSVAAHCHGTEGIVQAAAAGVRTIEHCSFAGPKGFGSDFRASAVERLAESGAWVSPTVNSGWGPRMRQDAAPTEFYRRMSHGLRALVAGGVAMIASTDAGIPGVEHHRLPDALQVFARYAGLSPLETLKTATSESARALGLGGEVGVLQPGCRADILVLKRDPLRDLSALGEPLLVIAGGRVVEGAAR